MTCLKVNGGVTASEVCMQLQADTLGIEVVRPVWPRPPPSAQCTEEPPCCRLPPPGPADRSAALDRLSSGEELDVLVIGAGVTGAGCALDAMTRGLTVGRSRARDFAASTSSRSTKLFHGGLRYLEQLRAGLRGAEGAVAGPHDPRPHLAHLVPFICPFQRAAVDRAYAGLGIGVYDVVGAGRGVPRHPRHLGLERPSSPRCKSSTCSSGRVAARAAEPDGGRAPPAAAPGLRAGLSRRRGGVRGVTRGALHLDDRPARRTRISIETPDRGVAAAAEVADLVAPVLGWDPVDMAREVEHYRSRVAAERESQQQPDDQSADARAPRRPGRNGWVVRTAADHLWLDTTHKGGILGCQTECQHRDLSPSPGQPSDSNPWPAVRPPAHLPFTYPDRFPKIRCGTHPMHHRKYLVWA
jgi:FAD dependent oxidoreductase